jgi:NADH:ubiquinone oxidoreductase subunit 5 (subunit L)/multisubunit Na+/H+ antiporter MnhA subunit
MLTGSLSLIAWPFYSGFYSKDLLLECIISEWNSISFAIYILGLICSFLTSFYSTRLIKLTFYGSTRVKRKNIITEIVEAPLFMMLPMIILTILSIISGYFLKEIYQPFSTFWRGSIGHNLW